MDHESSVEQNHTMIPQSSANNTVMNSTEKELFNQKNKGEYFQVCNLCDKSFRDKRYLESHMKTKHSNTSENNYYGEVPVNKHVNDAKNSSDEINSKKSPTKKNYFPCDICNKIFTSEVRLKTHLTLHTSDSQFLCDLCATPFHSAGNLRIHKLSAHGVKPIFQCKHCHDPVKKTFESKAELEQHFKSHHSAYHNTKGEIECSVCHEVFPNRETLRKHFSAVHNGQKMFVCKICERPFKTFMGLYHHKLTHSAVCKYSCDTCEKRFKTNIALYSHKTRVHKNNVSQLHVCSVCNKTFSLRSYLTQHFLSHSDKRLFSCEMCNKSYKEEKNLRVHQRMIHNNGLFSCRRCRKSFKSAKLMKEHVSSQYACEAQFKCIQCGRSYTIKSSLVRHMKSHNSGKKLTEYKLECEVCYRLHTTKGALRNHYQRHHNDYYVSHVLLKSNGFSYTCQKTQNNDIQEVTPLNNDNGLIIQDVTPVHTVFIKEELMDPTEYELQELDTPEYLMTENTEIVKREIVDPQFSDDISSQSLNLIQRNSEYESEIVQPEEEIECEINLNEGEDELNFHDSDNENVESVLS